MHHSPSSLKTAAACLRLWWYEHRLRIREPSVEWETVAKWAYDKPSKRFYDSPPTLATPWAHRSCTSRQRTFARGTATHAVLETYYEGGAPDWSTEPGQLAMRMRAHLPAREECLETRVEYSIGETPYPSEDEPDRTALMVDGVRFLGYVDLEVRITRAAAQRLGIECLGASVWVTFDYKTSRDVARYALTPEDAATDEQGVLYAYAGMVRVLYPERTMRWVYAQSEGAKLSKPVDVCFTLAPTRVHLNVFVERARNLERITSVDEATPNPGHCREYGGCPHHVSNGGPCTAVQSLGRMIAMGFGAAFKKQQAAGAGAPADTNTTPLADATGATDGAGEGGESTPPAPSPAKPPRTPKPKGGASVAGGLAETIATHNVAIAQAESAIADATAARDAAVAALKAALG